jgi:hypothetical protein
MKGSYFSFFYFSFFQSLFYFRNQLPMKREFFACVSEFVKKSLIIISKLLLFPVSVRKRLTQLVIQHFDIYLNM